MHLTKVIARISMTVTMLFALASGTSRAREPALEPEVAYYMTIFSAQAVGSRGPSRTHSFATFVKAFGTGEPAKGFPIEVHTISWMPRSLEIVVLRGDPEPGTNLDLQSSLRWAESKKSRVSMWGPYQIDEELFKRAVKQEARLNSGQVLYKANDRRFRPGSASNCIHAISDLDLDNGILNTGLGRGDSASSQVAEHLERWMINPDRKHAWVVGRLSLGGQSVVQRDLELSALAARQSRESSTALGK
jgi:hypothetical protein